MVGQIKLMAMEMVVSKLKVTDRSENNYTDWRETFSLRRLPPS